MNDEMKPLVFEQTGPDRLYLRQVLARLKWGGSVAGLLALVMECLDGRAHPLAQAIFAIALVGLAGGAVVLWVWVSGWVEEWSGRLPTPGHFAWFLGSTAVGAAAGWILHDIRFRGFVAPPNSIWFAAAIMGAIVGSPVAAWRTWRWLGSENDAPTLVDRGIALAGVKPVLAISCFTTALRMDPRYARAAYERARLLNGSGFGVDLRRAFKDPGAISMVRLQDAALLDVDTAIRLEPGYAAAYLLRADVYRSLTLRHEQSSEKHAERWEAVRADFTHAIRIDPGNASAYFGRGRATPSGEDGELADHERAVELAPEVAEYRFELGRVRRARGDLDRAITDLDEAIRLAPGLAWYHQERAEAFRSQGDYGRSEEDLARVRDIHSRL
jgi:Tetratricopeptide repeat